jgi:O-methyltransferase involved in polyketide biosynthesis
MYLQRAEVDQLLTSCARRFPGASLLFDALPRWMESKWVGRRMKHQTDFTAPEFGWSMNLREYRRVARLPGIAELRHVPWPKGEGLFYGVTAPTLNSTIWTRHRFIVVLSARFATS